MFSVIHIYDKGGIYGTLKIILKSRLNFQNVSLKAGCAILITWKEMWGTSDLIIPFCLSQLRPLLAWQGFKPADQRDPQNLI